MNYHNIKDVDLLNGVGLRTVLFVSGCSHNCPKCHNPQTHDPNSGIEFDDESINEIIRDLDHDYIDGLTLCGGDPLFKSNRSQILEIIKRVRDKFGDSKTIWMYTGYTYEYLTSLHDERVNSILKGLNILVDGPFILKLKDDKMHYRGSSNQRLIDVKSSLTSGNIILADY